MTATCDYGRCYAFGIIWCSAESGSLCLEGAWAENQPEYLKHNGTHGFLQLFCNVGVLCMCGFCNVGVLVCVGFVMCVCVCVCVGIVMYGCVYVGFVMCGCVYVWVL